MTVRELMGLVASTALFICAQTTAFAQTTTTKDPLATQGRALGPHDELQGPVKRPHDLGANPQDRELDPRASVRQDQTSGNASQPGGDPPAIERR